MISPPLAFAFDLLLLDMETTTGSCLCPGHRFTWPLGKSDFDSTCWRQLCVFPILTTMRIPYTGYCAYLTLLTSTRHLTSQLGINWSICSQETKLQLLNGHCCTVLPIWHETKLLRNALRVTSRTTNRYSYCTQIFICHLL